MLKSMVGPPFCGIYHVSRIATLWACSALLLGFIETIPCYRFIASPKNEALSNAEKYSPMNAQPLNSNAAPHNPASGSVRCSQLPVPDLQQSLLKGVRRLKVERVEVWVSSVVAPLLQAPGLRVMRGRQRLEPPVSQ